MKWKMVTGYSKPEKVEVGKTTAYLRKNIVEIKDKEGNQAWRYEEAQMSIAEYEKYLELMSSPGMELIIEKFNNQEIASAEIASETEYQTCLMELNQAM